MSLAGHTRAERDERRNIDDVLRALAQPNRLEMLWLLSAGELAAGQIASHFHLTRPAVSEHLGILLRAGLVKYRAVGARRFYRATPERLEHGSRYFEELGAKLPDRNGR